MQENYSFYKRNVRVFMILISVIHLENNVAISNYLCPLNPSQYIIIEALLYKRNKQFQRFIMRKKSIRILVFRIHSFVRQVYYEDFGYTMSFTVSHVAKCIFLRKMDNWSHAF